MVGSGERQTPQPPPWKETTIGNGGTPRGLTRTGSSPAGPGTSWSSTAATGAAGPFRAGASWRWKARAWATDCWSSGGRPDASIWSSRARISGRRATAYQARTRVGRTRMAIE